MNYSQCRTALRKRKERVDRLELILQADRRSLVKGTLYLYAKGKEGFYVSVMAEVMELVEKKLAKTVTPDLPADRFLAEVLQTYVGFWYKSCRDFGIIILSIRPDVQERVSEESLQLCLYTSGICMLIVIEVIERGHRELYLQRSLPLGRGQLLWATFNEIRMSYAQDHGEIVVLPLDVPSFSTGLISS